MRYLFFDIECCNGKNICEFGYVITDTDFNIIEKDHMLINPEAKFNLTRRKGHRDLYLHYTDEQYKQSKKFHYYYKRIKELIEYPDQIIVGHAISNDAIFLNIACKRYNLDAINFKFADTQKMYSEFFNNRKSASIETAGEKFGISVPELLHRSDEDSLYTMKIVKAMCDNMECSLQEMIELCGTCTGKTENFEVEYDFHRDINSGELKNTNNDEFINKDKNFVRGKNYKLFLQFLDGVKPKGEIIKSCLTGKTLCISLNYEYTHFKEMLAIVQSLTNHGATYKLKASLNDIFVTYSEKDENGNERTCTRNKYVNEAIQNGKQIEIISFEKLLEILDTSEQKLQETNFPDKTSFFKKQKKPVKKQEKSNDYIDKTDTSNTLGDLFPDIFEKLRNNQE